MKQINLFLISFFLCMSNYVNARILPENNLHLEDNLAFDQNMTEEEFNAIIKRVQDYYDPIVAQKKGRLIFQKYWNDSTVNAYANRIGNSYIVSMFGGLARRPEVTQDGFMLVVCHELGHHLAGFPFINDWAANEGQSDFFATHSCAKNIWKDDIATNSSFRNKVDAIAKNKCDSEYEKQTDQNLCYRSAVAGYSLAMLLSSLGGSKKPSFKTPDQSVSNGTFHGHPRGQCRLDTFLAGALCKVYFDENVIPGMKYEDEWLERKEKMEADSLIYTCSQFNPEHYLSQRPKCWFDQDIDDPNAQPPEESI